MKVKNFKVYKKLIALINAGIMMTTPIVANANEEDVSFVNMTSQETTVNNNENAFGDLVVQQEKFAEPINTLSQFNEEVNRVCNYLVQFNINYQGSLADLKRDVQCLYYLTNREHITGELDRDLINSRAINEITQDDWSTMVFALEVKNVIDDYNQSVIRNLTNIINLDKISYIDFDKELLNKYLLKVINDKSKSYTIINAIYDYNQEIMKIDETKVIDLQTMCLSYDVRLNEYLGRVVNGECNLEEAITEYNERITQETKEALIDVSHVCYDEHDRNLLHDMHENYFNAYKTGRFMNMERTEENEYFVKVFKQLTTLNAYEGAGNAFEVSMGARWLSQQSIGNNVMQMLRDDMQDHYTIDERAKYFYKDLLTQGQWWLRDDYSIDDNCPTDLELEVFKFGQLWWFCYDTVNIEMFESFGVKLDGETK